MSLFDEVRAGDPPEDQPGCDGCSWMTRALVRIERPFERGEHVWLCEVCWATPNGNAVQYPAQYPNRDVPAQIAYGTNMVLAALAKEV